MKHNIIESANKKPPAPGGGDDLDQVTGTTEDEFSEAIHFVREQELLFGQKSLLTIFGPIARHICANNTTFTVSFSNARVLIISIPFLIRRFPNSNRMPRCKSWLLLLWVNSCALVLSIARTIFNCFLPFLNALPIQLSEVISLSR